MKWISDWWGIVIITENETDKVLLAELKKALPEKAHSSYEEGNMETKKDFIDAIYTLTEEEREKIKAEDTNVIIFNR